MHVYILEHPQPRNFPRICVFIIQGFFTEKFFHWWVRAQTKTAPNDYNFTGTGRDFKQLFYILDYKTQKHQSTMLPGALPHILSEFCYWTPKILLHWVPSISYTKEMSLIRFKAVFPLRIYVTREEMQWGIQKTDITKYMGEDLERVFRFTWRKW